MTDSKKEIKTPKKITEKRTWEGHVLRILKWLAIFAVVIFILLTVLSRLGGNSDVLKGAVEDFLTDNTPYSVHVQTLNEMRFFPNMALDVSGVEFREGGDGTGEAAIRVGNARFALGFVDVMFRPGRFKIIEINGIDAMAGSLHSKAVQLERIGVDEVGGKAVLKAHGAIGKHKLVAWVNLEEKGKPTSPVYSLGDKRDFEINLAQLKIVGVLKSKALGGAKFEDVTLEVAGQKALSGHFDFDKDGDASRLKGSFEIQPDQSMFVTDLTVDLSSDQKTISGKIQSDKLILEDFSGNAPFIEALNTISAIMGEHSKTLDLSGIDLDVEFTAKAIKTGKVNLGSIATPLSVKENKLHIGPVDGKIVKGTLNGDIHLDVSEDLANFSQKIVIKNFDYAALQKQFSDTVEIEGKADIIVDLKSKGKTLDSLIGGLSGKAGFVGGKGRMNSDLLNIWGGGLLNAIVPDFEETEHLNLNCVVVNMNIENLKAKSDAVFIDTEKVTLHGEGTYDFKAGQLEMILEPKPKGISIGDISSAVNVSGPLSDLSVSPNVLDLGKRIGGLLLGAVNPAFYAVTLADLGLSDDHPCKSYVIEKEVLPAPKKPNDAEPEAPKEQSPSVNE